MDEGGADLTAHSIHLLYMVVRFEWKGKPILLEESPHLLGWSLLCDIFAQVGAALAARLLVEVDGLNLHALVERLAHVVDGQECDADGVQRFHLDTRFSCCFCLADCSYTAAFFLHDEINCYRGKI